jgi:hypothetical protein
VLHLLSIFFLFSVSFVQAQLLPKDQWNQWLKLLHYEKNTFGSGYTSPLSSGFFLTPDGSVNPENEWRANIEAMKKRGENSAQCLFPARYRFIKSVVQDKFTDSECLALRAFLQDFPSVESLSVVFSSAYAQSPASMFGHTFLKINMKGANDLRQAAVNYSASVPPDENPFAFAYFGLTGGYKGQWSVQPYYEKIKEYAFSEQRDLWEYELKLTPEESLLVLLHIWEIQTNSYFNYYFFNKNCSYQILAAIEAIKPHWKLLNYHIALIPGESTKSLVDGNYVKKIQFRPSFRKEALYQFNQLNPEQKNVFKKYIHSEREDINDVKILDAAMAYDHYQMAHKGSKFTLKESEQINKTLQNRAIFQGGSLEKDNAHYSNVTQPDIGHDAYSLSLGEARNDAWETQLTFKTAYHDLMNNDFGHSPYSHIDFPSIQFSYNHDLNKAYISQFKLLAVTSLAPISFVSNSPSWKLDVGMDTPQDKHCLACRSDYIELGGGISFDELYLPFFFSGLMTFRQEKIFSVYGPGVDLNIFFTGENHKFRLGKKYFFNLADKNDLSLRDESQVQLSYFAHKNLEWRSGLTYTRLSKNESESIWSGKSEIIYFFN